MATDGDARTPILCFSGVDWDYLTMRHHQVMSRLSRHRQVLFVEAETHLLSLFRGPRKFRKLWQWAYPPKLIADGLYVYAPPIVLPFGRTFGVINSLNQFLVGVLARLAMRRLGLSAPILWLYEPEHHALMGHFGEGFVVYDRVDLHAAFPRWQRPRLVEAMEQSIVARADVIFAASSPLASGLPAHRTYIIRNGVDVSLFASVADPSTSVPSDVVNLPRPVIGFVGTVDAWVDVDLLARVASELPRASVVVIGPVRAGRKALRYSNIHLLGPRPHASVPAYLKGFDVCLLPFRINALTEASSPLKLYEYVAAGKPVVSTDIPEARRFSEWVVVAPDSAAFISAVKWLLQGSLGDRRPPPMVPESWDARAAQIEEILAKHLNRRMPGIRPSTGPQ